MGPRESLEDAAAATVIHGPGGQIIRVLVVCDGVGGCALGEIASATAVSSIHASLQRFVIDTLLNTSGSKLDVQGLAAALYETMLLANDAVIERARTTPGGENMATTVVCAVVMDDHLFIIWAGDSRCYVYSNGKLHRLTEDHTEVARLVEMEIITADEAAAHPDAHTITQYLGRAVGFEPQLRIQPLTPGDVLLLCTDGLTDVLTDEDIAAILANEAVDVESLSETLVQRALWAGTADNTTALIFGHEPQRTIRTFHRTCVTGYPVAVASALTYTENAYERRSNQHQNETLATVG